jgi:hypothetical protein
VIVNGRYMMQSLLEAQKYWEPCFKLLLFGLEYYFCKTSNLIGGL